MADQLPTIKLNANQRRHFEVLLSRLEESLTKIERLLDNGLLLPPYPPGTVVNIVDMQDQQAELAPRAYPLGLVLQEVNSEWGPAGTVTFTVFYVNRPADLSITGALTQPIGLPDRFSAWLDYELAIYFNQKDLARAAADPDELKRLAGLQEAVYQDILQYLDHVVGPAIRRFVLPTPRKGEKA